MRKLAGQGAAVAAVATAAFFATGSRAVHADGGLEWPNANSAANSDDWLAQHHDEISVMRPRVLVINFVNGFSRADGLAKVDALRYALAVGSRYHGTQDASAPAFLQYQLAKYVDLQDRPPAAHGPASQPAPPREGGDPSAPNPGRDGLPSSSIGLVGALEAAKVPPENATVSADVHDVPPPDGSWTPSSTPDGNSTLYPRVKDRHDGETNLDYQQLFTDRFAGLIDMEDDSGTPLALRDLVDQGRIHELWLICKQGPDSIAAPWEVVEVKQRYDGSGRKIAGSFATDAGNSGAHTAPWIGRSLRILFINSDRGIGCAVHSLGHGMEGTAHSGAIPYFSRYFQRYAGFDLDSRYGLSFNSLYAGTKPYAYPDAQTLVYPGGRVDGYVAAGGNVHFPPNARSDYDDQNPDPVLSTIEHFGLKDGDSGQDRAEPWTVDRFAPLAGTAPDGEGDWNVYWRQNMPGLGNRATDDDGNHMKNWWPYLFY